MAYLEEFRVQLNSRNYTKLMTLWQEYCAGDMADGEEIIAILKLIKDSDCAQQFGQYVEAIIPLVTLIKNKDELQESYRLIFDIETLNTPALYDLAFNFLKDHYGQSSLFNEKLRLIGLRGAAGDNFQGALSNFLLLNHMQKGNFVLHTAGWGVGEIMDLSFLREQASIEFENLRGGKKDISFKNGFKTLIPLAKTHFLARRFAEPDLLEKDLKENPVAQITAFLSDMGPKTAQEIKDEIAGIVIPEEEYSKWWQQARAKMKKEPLIETPALAKETFRLRKGHASWEERLEKAFLGKNSFEAILTASHNVIRDFPELLKNSEAKQRLIEKVQGLLLKEKLSEAEHLQVLLFLENTLNIELEASSLKKFVIQLRKVDEVLKAIEIVNLKKRLCSAIREYRQDWAEIFLQLLFTCEQNQLRDLLLKDLLNSSHTELLKARIKELMDHPRKHPEALLWYFQKVVNDEAPFFQDQEHKYQFFEALLILLSALDLKSEHRDFSKKIYNYLTGSRFQAVRDILKNSTQDFAREFLLLTSKCQSFTDHDKKILHSLVEVVHTSLAKEKKLDSLDLNTIWTTQEGFSQIQERIKHIGTVEIIDVAKEIEAARAHGDLRENSEYKFALERRNRLQGELKMLSDQFHKARIITKEDISTKSIGIGTKVELMGPKGEKICYTILGPWDANPDNFILSFQSKFAQAMWGKKLGEKFAFKGDEFKILATKSYLEG